MIVLSSVIQNFYPWRGVLNSCSASWRHIREYQEAEQSRRQLSVPQDQGYSTVAVWHTHTFAHQGWSRITENHGDRPFLATLPPWSAPALRIRLLVNLTWDGCLTIPRTTQHTNSKHHRANFHMILAKWRWTTKLCSFVTVAWCMRLYTGLCLCTAWNMDSKSSGKSSPLNNTSHHCEP